MPCTWRAIVSRLSSTYRFRILLAEFVGLLDGVAGRVVAFQFVVGARLVGDDVGDELPLQHPFQHVCGIDVDADGVRFPGLGGFLGLLDGFVQVVRLLHAVAGLDATVDSVLVHFGGDADAVVHRDRESGWAPPIPPRPPVTTILPERSPSYCSSASAASVS